MVTWRVAALAGLAAASVLVLLVTRRDGIRRYAYSIVAPSQGLEAASATAVVDFCPDAADRGWTDDAPAPPPPLLVTPATATTLTPADCNWLSLRVEPPDWLVAAQPRLNGTGAAIPFCERDPGRWGGGLSCRVWERGWGLRCRAS
jgi:hypothetical protein